MSNKVDLIDLADLEKKAGRKAARTLQRNWKNILATATTKQSGVLLANSNVRIKMKYGELDHLSINTTSVGMKLHYGFEGTKKNGAAMRMQPLNTVEHLFKKSNTAIVKLANEIAEIRGYDVATKIVS
jgi:hypothetical protein